MRPSVNLKIWPINHKVHTLKYNHLSFFFSILVKLITRNKSKMWNMPWPWPKYFNMTVFKEEKWQKPKKIFFFFKHCCRKVFLYFWSWIMETIRTNSKWSYMRLHNAAWYCMWLHDAGWCCCEAAWSGTILWWDIQVVKNY